MASKAKAKVDGASPIRLLRIHGKVARELGTAIVSGRYRPGEILYGEIDASDRL